MKNQNSSRNWRTRFLIDIYDSLGLDISKLIVDEKKFQRLADIVIISLLFTFLGFVVAIVGALIQA
jgi:hypothetical protein